MVIMMKYVNKLLILMEINVGINKIFIAQIEFVLMQHQYNHNKIVIILDPIVFIME